MSIEVPDISSYQPSVDWKTVVLGGIGAMFFKATEGATWNDPTFISHVKGAHSVGISVGAYHFAHPESNDPIAEAKHFVSALQQTPTDLMPVLDLESPTSPGALTGAEITAWARSFVDYVQAQTGRKVMLYTGVWYVNTYGLSGLGDLPLWIADYGVPSVPQCGDWTSYLMWQYTDSETVNGIPGKVDMSYAPSVDALRGNYTEGDMQPMSNPTVQLNSTGSAVAQLQKDLIQLGYTVVGSADGAFGPHTLQGVEQFQKDHGLTQDGVVGPATWAALNAALQPKPAPKPTPQPPASTGPTPDDIQKALSLLEQATQLLKG
ncbi:GH25 family lysozyme [Alicyclobacillus dauci]|uniref:GH25 family lysozyme n=1 Tax=Alicyclobacillus dauci TaxID=1475485 RepID=A0ABY6YWY0_9BACL|nr:GH25 family lysozyme [Alicyclobacillus dauci]WAH35063.1 GH25 family lysozyme [Alicyclobacillus dauci]